jgi:precorrin isomerase
VSELSREFEIHAGLIRTWRYNAKASPKHQQVRSRVLEATGDQDVAGELRMLRRKVAELQLLDNDIKKRPR